MDFDSEFAKAEFDQLRVRSIALSEKVKIRNLASDED
jgi:hypothetical protein